MTKPYRNTLLTKFLEKRVLEPPPIKTEAEIASESRVLHPNMMALSKNGTARLPLDRVPALAMALDVDSARLLQLALEQWAGSGASWAFNSIFETSLPKTRSDGSMKFGMHPVIPIRSSRPVPALPSAPFWEVARCTIFFSAAGDGLAKP
jgi:hypothetical protein